MARETQITVGAFSFAVRVLQRQAAGADGKALFHQNGEPKMVDAWVIDIIEQTPLGDVTVTHLPLVKEAKDELVRQLSGGVVVATAMPTEDMAARL